MITLMMHTPSFQTAGSYLKPTFHHSSSNLLTKHLVSLRCHHVITCKSCAFVTPSICSDQSNHKKSTMNKVKSRDSIMILFSSPLYSLNTICSAISNAHSVDVHFSDQCPSYLTKQLDLTNVFYIGHIGSNNYKMQPANKTSSSILTHSSALLKYGVTYRLPARVQSHNRTFDNEGFTPIMFAICDANRQVESKVKAHAKKLSRSSTLKSNTELIAVDTNIMLTSSCGNSTHNNNSIYSCNDFMLDVFDIIQKESQMLHLRKQMVYNFLV